MLYQSVQVTTRSSDETEALAAELAAARAGIGDDLEVIYLTGDLGAGKTTFARGFLRGLGEAGAVRSPTYTLLELHELSVLTVLHVDLYRLRDERELESLGLRDWARPGCLWLIEWPERASTGLPPADLVLTFTVGSASHTIGLAAASDAGDKWLARLAAAGPRGSGSDAPGPAGKAPG